MRRSYSARRRLPRLRKKAHDAAEQKEAGKHQRLGRPDRRHNRARQHQQRRDLPFAHHRQDTANDAGHHRADQHVRSRDHLIQLSHVHTHLPGQLNLPFQAFSVPHPLHPEKPRREAPENP